MTAAVDAPARAECRVDLTAIAHNVRLLRQRLAAGTELWAVVKADAYGHGVSEVSRCVLDAGAERLCVSTVSEATHLRAVGIAAPLLTMGPVHRDDLHRIARLDASVTVVGSQMVDDLVAMPPLGGRPLPVHLKVDTGMGRWGVPLDAALQALDALAGAPGVAVEGLMTHFATADHADPSFMQQQLARFHHIADAAMSRHPDLVCHAANSAAVMAGAACDLGAVRCGIALYGLAPDQGDAVALGLRPAMSLTSRVAELRQLDAGDSVGYGCTFVATGPTRTALVPVGYADGVMRALSNRATALVRGRRCQFAGIVSMDHLSLVVDDSVQCGDEVTLIGVGGSDRVSAEEHARLAGTINYEVTCGMATEPRLPRRYLTRDVRQHHDAAAGTAQ